MDLLRSIKLTYTNEKAIALKYGFKNVTELRASIRVVTEGSKELIEAMDKKLLSVHQAEKLLDLSHEVQLELLSNEKAVISQKINNYLKEDREKRNARTIKLVKTIFTHPGLLEAEKATRLPLCHALSELLMITGLSREFRWDAKALKKKIFPHSKVNFSSILEALINCRMIEKNGSVGKFLWDPVINLEDI